MKRAPARALVASSNALSKSSGLSYLQRMKLESQLPCRELDFFPMSAQARPVDSRAQPRGRAWDDFLEQLQPFSSQLRSIWDKPVTLPPGRARLSTSPVRNRVTRTRHNDRDCPGSFFGSQSIGSSRSDDDVNLETDEIGCEVREAIVSTLRIAVLDDDVLSLDPSEVAQTRRNACARARSGRRVWRSDNPIRGTFAGCCAWAKPHRHRESDSNSEKPPPIFDFGFDFGLSERNSKEISSAFS